nr:type VI secretion system Vgr family protein [uncultured Noviherbaspirillum sp.]
MPVFDISQTDRSVSVHCELQDDVLLFQEMHGTEQLGRLFEYRIKLLSSKGDIRIADVLGKPMHVRVGLGTEANRYIHGLVTRFSRHGQRGEFHAYEATIRPALWLLTRSSDCRIFQDKSIFDILREVCDATAYGGQVKLRLEASATPAKRTYCVQYRETDFDFVSRLLEEEGMYYYFEHKEQAHTMVIVDSYGAHSKVAGYESVAFHPGEGRSGDDESVIAWSPAGQIESSIFTLNDYDFTKFSASAHGGLAVKTEVRAAFDQPGYEQYDYPGRYASSTEGDLRTRAWLESVHGQSEQFHGVTSARGLHSGALFSLEDHPNENDNREVLITESTLDVVGQDYVSGAGANTAMSFTCRFIAVGQEHSYRPPRVHRKPVVRGPQTAVVVGKSGKEIWTDEYGRVKVQFHWDRVGKDDENSSCWVRVSQGWSGKGWGAMFIPRIGMEVVVAFLEGDPDRPLVTGCVYNSDAMPPYALPANQTRSTVKSNSSKGGNGFNEIRFEDEKDQEEVYVHAERDFNRVVMNNDTLKVGFEKKDKGDQTVAIHHDQSLDVGNDRTVHVANNQATTVDKDMSTEVGVNQTLKIGKDQSIDVGASQKIDVGTTCVIEAGTSIELKVGASSIKIEPAKITIKSVQIAIQADAMMAIKAGAVMTVEGAMVKIN